MLFIQSKFSIMTSVFIVNRFFVAKLLQIRCLSSQKALEYSNKGTILLVAKVQQKIFIFYKIQS